MNVWSQKLSGNTQVWLPAAVVLVAGAALSWAAAGTLLRQLDDMGTERVVHQAEMFTAALEQRVQAYGDIVQGMQTVFALDPDLSRERFASSLSEGVYRRHQGVRGMSFSRQVSTADYSLFRERLEQESQGTPLMVGELQTSQSSTDGSYLVVDYSWPLHGATVQTQVDVKRQLAARELFRRVRETRELQMSAPMLMQRGEEAVTGLLISAPVEVPAEDTSTSFVGTINLSVEMAAIIDSLRDKGVLPDASFTVRDVGAWPAGTQWMVGGSVLYASEGWGQPGYLPAFEREIELLGRRWVLEFSPERQVVSGMEAAYPWLVGVAGTAGALLAGAIVLLLGRQRQRAEAQAQDSAKHLEYRTDRFRALFNQSAVGVAEVDPQNGHYVHVNTRFAEILGYTVEELSALDIYQVTASQEEYECRRLVQGLASGQLSHYAVERCMQRKDGQLVWAELWASRLVGTDGQPLDTHLMMLQDVTERHQMQELLRKSEAYSGEMLRYTPVGLVVVGHHGQIEYVNEQFEELTGLTLGDVPDENALWRQLCPDATQLNLTLQRMNTARCQAEPAGGGRIAPSEHMLQTKAGLQLPVEVSGRFLGERILLAMVDLSQRKQAEAQIRWLAYYDTLTQLPNRRMLLEQLEACVPEAYKEGVKGALLLLDIDNFKTLNETLGHQHGDALLRLVATRLTGTISHRHILARQGGDEFAVVLEGLPGDRLEAARQAEQMGMALLQAFRTPFFLGGQELHVSVSMGAAVFGEDTQTTVDDLFKRADLALYQAKSAGRATLQFFDPSMQQAVSERVEMEKDLRLALERHEFDLYYQPQVKAQQVVGAEALLRWKHPRKGFISPGVFVPAAEESGLILQLGEWVLYAACRQLAAWAADPELAHLSMSVNVSPRQFFQADFVAQVQRALEVTGARAERLDLELTEGMLLTDVDGTVQKMQKLRAMGVSFSLDDFGTGYSSLSYLKRLPLDKLKIDQSFVREVLTSAHDASIARTIVALGHSLSLRVVAEGVETEAQRNFMANIGCDFWQGYLFSRPVPNAEFEQWTRAYQRGNETVNA